jgi:hypothetical protein
MIGICFLIHKKNPCPDFCSGQGTIYEKFRLEIPESVDLAAATLAAGSGLVQDVFGTKVGEGDSTHNNQGDEDRGYTHDQLF